MSGMPTCSFAHGQAARLPHLHPSPPAPPMPFLDALLLFAAAAGGGALNAVAGGGSFLTFPMLLFLGVPPITANATSTVALWPGSVASTGAYRRELRAARAHLVPLSVVSLVGGLAGALLLLHTPQATFRGMVPWLLLAATLIFAFGGPLVARLRRKAVAAAGGPAAEATAPLPAAGFAAQFGIATYGGFFGGGIGILMLAALTLAGMEDVHAMNGLKNWLAVCINGIAVVTFVVAGAVWWPQALVMVGGAVAGGYAAASAARRVRPVLVRRFVIAVGAAMTLYFFLEG